MTTAELIVRALDAAKLPEAAAEEDDQTVRRYAQTCRELYSEFKKAHDFQTAARKAQVEIVCRIQIDFAALEPGEEIPE